MQNFENRALYRVLRDSIRRIDPSLPRNYAAALARVALERELAVETAHGNILLVPEVFR